MQSTHTVEGRQVELRHMLLAPTRHWWMFLMPPLVFDYFVKK